MDISNNNGVIDGNDEGAKVNGTKMDVPIQTNDCEISKASTSINNNGAPDKFLVRKCQSERIDVNDNVKNGYVELQYKDDQWSPSNPNGKKCYDADFLHMLRYSYHSQQKPKLDLIAPDLSLKLTRSNTANNASAKSPLSENGLFAPAYMSKGSHARGGTPSRRSQGKHGSKGGDGSGGQRRDDRRGGGGGGGGGGGAGGGGGGSNNKSNVIQISLNKDIKLNECENAWKSSRGKKEIDETSETAQTEEIYKMFRSILNKLTPQNFKKLSEQVKELKINNMQILSTVIKIVFEKAIDEPNFAEIYAQLCKDLGGWFKVNDPATQKEISFHRLLVGQCQYEFEKNKDEERLSSTKSTEIDQCADPEKQKILRLELAEEERTSRKRAVGNVKFIGELYKKNCIGNHIMITCITCLLIKIEEETMECLCKLLMTIGKILEVQQKQDLTKYIDEMKRIADDKTNKLNSRIRFMIRDVVEMRQHNWTPRQNLATPKKLNEIQVEAEIERHKSSYSKYPSSMSSSQRDDRAYSGRAQGSRSVSNDNGEWSPVVRKGGKLDKVDTEKLRGLNLDKVSNISLQPSCNSMWGLGSASGKKDFGTNAPRLGPANNYNKKAPIATTKIHNPFNVLRQDVAEPSVAAKQSKKPTGNADKPPEKPAKSAYTFDSLVQEFMGCSGDLYSELLDIILLGPAKKNMSMIEDLIRWTLSNYSNLSRNKRVQAIGKVTGALVSQGVITSTAFLMMLKNALEKTMSVLVKDLQVWDYFSKFFWAHCQKHELTFSQLHLACKPIIDADRGYECLMALFLEKIEDSNEEHLVKRLWTSSSKDMTLLKWMTVDRALDFLKCMDLEFIQLRTDTKKPLEHDDIVNDLLGIMRCRTTDSVNQAEQWIEANIGEDVKQPYFIRALTEAVYVYTLCSPNLPPRFDSERLSHYNKFLIEYVAGSALQLQCLLAIQSLMNKLEHPNGIALSIFENLWDSEIISSDTFFVWESYTEMPMGKGVMLKMLTSFLAALKTDVDSSDETSPDGDEEQSNTN